MPPLYDTEEVNPSACRMMTMAPAENQALAESDEVPQLLFRTYTVEHVPNDGAVEQWSRSRTLSCLGTRGAAKSLSLPWDSIAGRAIQRPAGAGTRTRPRRRTGRPAMVPVGRPAGAPDRHSYRATAGSPPPPPSDSARPKRPAPRASPRPLLWPRPQEEVARRGARGRAAPRRKPARLSSPYAAVARPASRAAPPVQVCAAGGSGPSDPARAPLLPSAAPSVAA